MRKWDIMGAGIRGGVPLTKKWLGSGWKPTPTVPIGRFPGWSYRSSITIEEQSGSNLENYQVLVELNDTNFNFEDAQSNGEDIRFTLDDYITLVDYWIEEWDKTNKIGKIWVEVPSIPALGTKVIYMHYGNSSANSASNGENTFEFFDDFEDFRRGEWSPYSGNPVLGSGKTFASVWKDSSTYWLYYHRLSDNTICRASSSDGKTNWTDDAAHNPVLSKSASGWDDYEIGVPLIWKEGTTWHMLYRGYTSAEFSKEGHATSPDGHTWTKDVNNPVLEDSSAWIGSQGIEANGLIKVGSTYYLWYSNWGTRQLGLATATNISGPWTKDENNPIIGTGRFCPCIFKRGSYYYLLVPHYTSGSDYSELELYRDTNPTFYSGLRELVKVVKTCPASGWDSHDEDTPSVLTTDINRDSFPSTELWTYYAGEFGGTWKTGLLIETDIGNALAKTSISWTEQTTGGTVAITSDIKKHGSYSFKFHRTGAGAVALYIGHITKPKGVTGVWMRRTTSTGNFDMYVYNDAGTLTLVVGLGNSGKFHYWNGSFYDTAVDFSADIWYLVTYEFDCSTDKFNFVVYNTAMTEICRVDTISFAAASTNLKKIRIDASSAITGDQYADVFRVHKYASPEPLISITKVT